jgi:hypothetical protein
MSTVRTFGPETSSIAPDSSWARASATTASMSSCGTSAGATRAIVPPTGTLSFTPTTNAPTTLVHVDSSSPAILSVSISHTSAPSVSSSPTATSQSVTLPDSMDRPHLGIVIRSIRLSTTEITGSTRSPSWPS